ncbi:MAG: GTP-binding protein, partial [Eudoraea sp.]|nr:GTP-binding protein [Eudoraea sp.]
FGVATFFIIFGIWAYSSAALDHPYGVQVGAMIFMVVLWFTLYFFGRAGKRKGKPQMSQLFNFMKKTLSL